MTEIRRSQFKPRPPRPSVLDALTSQRSHRFRFAVNEKLKPRAGMPRPGERKSCGGLCLRG